MAWISGLADKAENILNKLDQNAATALSQVPQNANDVFVEMRSGGKLNFKTVNQPFASNKNFLDSNVSKVRSASDLQQYRVPTTAEMGSIDSKDAITINVSPEEYSSSCQNDIENSYSSSFSKSDEIALGEVTSESQQSESLRSQITSDTETNLLKMRVVELENLARCLNEAMKEESSKLQNANSIYMHSISELEANLAKLQQEYLDTTQKLEMQIKETEQQRQDLQEYRLKAQHTLQMKDNLINELKSKGPTFNGGETSDDSHVLELENITLRRELDSIKEERQAMFNQVEQLREQLQELSKEHARHLSELRDNEVGLRKELRLERERVLTNESEQRLLTKEIYTLRQQYNQHMADIKARLQEKELQLQRLKNEKCDEGGENASRSRKLSDVESRLKGLTQALVDKQQKVEIITSERNALRIQLEKLQEQFATFTQNFQNSKSTRNAFLSNSTDDVKAQFPLLMTPNPFDNRLARKVKRAYSSLDSAGVRLGTFLRRYPLMRVFVLMYVALLHIWVMFVLLFSTPN